jgi:hypothetical protein
MQLLGIAGWVRAGASAVKAADKPERRAIVYQSDVYTPQAYPKFVRGSIDGLPSESTNGMLAIGESVCRARWRAGLTQRRGGG